MSRARTLAASMLLATLVPALPASSMADGPSMESWRIVSFLEDAQLEERGIFHIGFEADGTVWVAASDGLLRYDGYHWRRYTVSDGLPSDYVRCVCITRSGVLWVGTDRGVSIYDGGSFHSPSLPPLAGPSVRRIVEDSDNALWFCCDQWPDGGTSCGLSRLHQGKITTYTTADGLPSNYASDYLQDSRGRQFVATRYGLAQWQNGRWSRPLEDAGFVGSNEYVWSIVELSDHRVLAATDRSIFILDEDTWSQQIEVNIPKHPKLTTARDGTLLSSTFGSEGGVLQWLDGSFVPASATIRSIQNSPECVAEAPDGGIWIVGFRMISRWSRQGDEWEVANDLPPPSLRDDEGGVWFADTNRVVRLFQDVHTDLEDVSGPLFIHPKDRTIWMRGSESIRIWERGQLIDRRVPDAYDSRKCRLACDENGTTWCMDAKSIHTWEDEAWKDLDIELEASETLDNLCTGKDEDLWLFVSDNAIGSYRLVRVTSSGIDEVPIPTRTSRYQAPRILAASGGGLWLYGIFGLYEGECQSPGIWKPRTDLLGKNLKDAIEYSNDIWFICGGFGGGKGGVMRTQEGGLLHFPLAASHIVSHPHTRPLIITGRSTITTVAEGDSSLSHSLSLPRGRGEMAVGSAVCVGKELWINAENQVLKYTPDGNPPDTRILPGPTQFSVGQPIDIRVEGITRFRPRSENRPMDYSYRVGQGEWSPFARLGREGIRLSRLEIGNYSIDVRLRDEGLDVDPSPARVHIRVAPVPIQERAWFKISAISVLITLITLTAYLLSARRRLSQQAAVLETKVQARTGALAASERKFRSLFESSSDAVFLIDSSGFISDVTPSGCRLLESSREDLIGRSLSHYFHELPPNFDMEFQAELTLASGRFLRLTLRRQKSSDSATKEEQLIARDITERTALENRLKEKQKMEALGLMASGVAHDFNNILTAIIGFSELALLRSESEAVSRDLKMVLKETRRSIELIKKIQTFSRGQAVPSQAVNLDEIIRDLEPMLRQILGPKSTLEVRCSTPSPALLDSSEFEQVLVNLIVNAHDSEPSGVNVSVELSQLDIEEPEAHRLSLQNSGAHHLIKVTDDGCGMDSETLRRAFEPFFSTKAYGSGTGLGLATVYGAVQQHEGAIEIESYPGQGTTVRIYLPVHSGALPREKKTRANSKPTRGRENVLVVEDNEGTREFIVAALVGAGYEVVSTHRAQEALKILKSTQSFDIVITDILMPEMSGRELAHDMAESFPEIPIMFITGYDPGDEEHFDGIHQDFMNPQNVLRKPFGPTELTRFLRQCLDTHDGTSRAPRTNHPE